MSTLSRTAGVMLSLAAGLLLASCASKVTRPEQFSGFLSDYSQLQEVKLENGSKTLRWVKPGLKGSDYQSILIEPVVVFPEPVNAEQVDAKTVKAAAAYLGVQLHKQMGNVRPVVETAAPGTLRLRVAITGVETRAQDFKAYEVIPIALIVAGVTSAAGTRDRNVDTYLEVEISDAGTGEILSRAVKKGISPTTIENRDTAVTLDDVKPTLDQWAKDGAQTLKVFLNQ